MKMKKKIFTPGEVVKNLLKKPLTPEEFYKKIFENYGTHIDSAIPEIIETLSSWLNKGYLSINKEGKYKLKI